MIIKTQSCLDGLVPGDGLGNAFHPQGATCMDALSCSPYPHHAWLAQWLAVSAPRFFDVVECRHVTHRVMLTVAGSAEIRWTSRGTDTSFRTTTGNLGFFPCDRRKHTLCITSADGFLAYEVFMPAATFHRCRAEDVTLIDNVRALPFFQDTLAEASLSRLSSTASTRQLSEEIGDEIAARHLVERICVATGARLPAWRRAASVFGPADMRRLIEDIDINLAVPLRAESIAGTVGLSAGHFARKFQHSAGMSLGRFTNSRRIGMSLAMLRQSTVSLAGIALDLGFVSQSHFTRLFSSHTGISPEKFRRQHRRMGV